MGRHLQTIYTYVVYLKNILYQHSNRLTLSNNKLLQIPSRQHLILLILTLKLFQRIICPLKSTKKREWTEYTGFFMKIKKTLHIIFLNSSKADIFPSIWKKALVTPILKSGKHELLTNYSLISKLRAFTKALYQNGFER